VDVATLSRSSARIRTMKKSRAVKKPERNIWEPRNPNDPPLTPGSHEQLWQTVVTLPTDVEPWGQREPGVVGNCSCGCRWFLPLVAMPLDWGVCANPASPRVGLLTFEHQGCPQFEGRYMREDGSDRGLQTPGAKRQARHGVCTWSRSFSRLGGIPRDSTVLRFVVGG
jgi:hypothetical protein